MSFELTPPPRTAEDERVELIMTCCFAAVREHFSHLSVQDIINPPSTWRDAFVALHIATHILCEEFGVSRTYASRLQGRSKVLILRSIERVRERRATPAFEKVYTRLVARAVTLHSTEQDRMVA
jgi:hypothetical protein